jgi:hypothetical protein
MTAPNMRLTITGASGLTGSRDVTVVDAPPPSQAPVIVSFSPLNGVPGDVITIDGPRVGAATQVRFGEATTVFLTVVSSSRITVAVPIGATTGPIRVTTAAGFADSSQQFSVGAFAMDGPATIRRQRFVEWEAEAYSAVPVWSAIPSERRVTVSGSTHADFVTAVNTAAALTGGPRLVIVPDGFRATGRLMPPNNADLAHPIHIAWSRIVDGSYAITRGVRVPDAAPATAPLLETRDEGISRLGPVISFGVTLGDAFVDSSAQSNYRFWGLNLRVREDCPVDRVCDTLIYHGWGFDPLPTGTPSQQPDRNVFSHCWTGGRAFRPDGTWYQGNLLRLIRNAGRRFAFVDSTDTEHGSSGSTGDQGLYSSTIGQGPTLIRNIFTDYGGGICFLNGGADHSADPWPNHDDFELSYSFILRAARYHPTTGQVDSAGNRCTWLHKNQYETKLGGYWRARRNLFMGHWTQGQESAVILKAVNQNGLGRFLCTYDTSFVENIIIVRAAAEVAVAFAINGLEFYQVPPGSGTQGGTRNLMQGLRRLQVRGNVMIGAQSGIVIDGACIRIRMGAPLAGQEPGGWWSFVENLFDIHPSAYRAGNGVVRTSFPTHSIAGTFVFSRNVAPNIADDAVSGGFTGEDDTGGGAFGLNAAFDDRMMIDGAGALTVVDNAIRSVGGVQPSPSWNVRGAAQRYYSSMAAMGLTRTNADTLDVAYSYDAGSPLLTAATGGGRIGPDLAFLALMRAAVVSRDIRSILS